MTSKNTNAAKAPELETNPPSKADRRGWCPDAPPAIPGVPDNDPFGAGPAFKALGASVLSKPVRLLSRTAGLARAQLSVTAKVGAAALHKDGAAKTEEALSEVFGRDARFKDPAWRESSAHGLLAAWWKLASDFASELVDEAPGLDPHARRKAAFFSTQLLDMLSPSNAFWLNPAALKAFRETGGKSALSGVKNWVSDLRRGAALPSNTDRDSFAVGQDLAVTPGKVVARTRLAEIIQYAPTTKKVHAVPLVIVPHWINKFYILDLQQKNSFVRHLVDAGFTVFLISWKNPDKSLRDISFAEYIQEGVIPAKQVAAEITGQPNPTALGFCIGGMLLAMAQSWLKGAGEEPFGAIALLAAMVDFEDPGPIKVFIDERSIRHIEGKMARRGYLDSHEMGSSFAFLRGGDLVWPYFAENYLMGKTPPAFDMLRWNSDGTRMPAAFHSDYLRNMYLNNLLRVPNAIEVAGVPIDLGRITEDAYVVASERDHIAPPAMAHRIHRYVRGPVRFVLASSGHIAGIINPPSRGKGTHSVTPDGAAPCSATETLDQWRARSEQREGSWWNDYTGWLAARSGDLVAPPKMGSKKNKAICDAPGTFIYEQ